MPPSAVDPLAKIQDRIEHCRRSLFAGRMPEPLKRVVAIYIELAGERLARGEPVGAIEEAVAFSIENAAALERGARDVDLKPDWELCEA
ncbi:MAG TPA: hypothetical protein VNX28_03765 [Gemmataceae bacterium]|nr:hypothetical protein [Gemmataceae bacterium]